MSNTEIIVGFILAVSSITYGFYELIARKKKKFEIKKTAELLASNNEWKPSKFLIIKKRPKRRVRKNQDKHKEKLKKEPLYRFQDE